MILRFGKPLFVAGLIAAGLAMTSNVLRADPLTDEQLSKIIKELNLIEEQVNGKRIKTRASAVEAFRNASTSDKAAYEFYLACVKEMQFDRKDARFSEFRDWRDKNEARLKDPGNMAAMRLQLQYLVLTLRAAEGVEMEMIIPELEAFVAGIVNNSVALEGGMRTLRQSVAQTVFAEAYELDQSLRMENWSYTPGNVDSVYQKTLFPYYREHNPEGLAQAWDRRIELATRETQLTDAEDPVALQKFQTERLPRLNWQRGTDIFQFASQPQGALAMLQVLRANPDHPDATEWVKQFRNLLSNAAAPPAPASVPSE